jgi:hypothetical protein
VNFERLWAIEKLKFASSKGRSKTFLEFYFHQNITQNFPQGMQRYLQQLNLFRYL